MRLGIVSDIHTNAVGLATALERMGDVDELLCVGDVVEEYRFGNDAVELLRERGARCVLGNHDVGLLAPHGQRARSAPHVRQDLVDWLAKHPLTIDVRVGGPGGRGRDGRGKRLLMTHASPCPPHTQYVVAISAELKRIADVDADYVIIGHTHAQMATRVGRALVINPGSAGQARDPSNGRRLSYAVLDTETDEVTIDDYDFVLPALPT